jgi:DNA-binding beta-propeller fold protein YncE
MLLLAATASLLVNPIHAQQVPQFEVDPWWPNLPLADNWLTGGLGGLCIDSRDHVFLLNRQNVVEDDLDGASLAPPVIELDPDGNVVGGWGDPQRLGGRLHDCHVDAELNVWIVAAATGVVQKYSSDGGELLMQIGETGTFDSSDGSRQGRPLNSDRAQFFLPGSIDVDPVSGDIFVADGELPGGNFRIAVLDSSGQFLRQWPLQRSENESAITPLPHCLRLSVDGLVYVCDRQADRIQVFDQQGRFIRNIDVGFEPLSSPVDRSSGTRGTAVVLAFSADAQQRFMYVINQNSVMIDVLERQSGQLLTSFGAGPGRYRGQFTLPHGIAVDSSGNVYIAEQEGRRVQKFNFLGLSER